MALSYDDLPVTTGTRCFATYQNFLRSAIEERAARVGAAVVLPALINAGDKIEDTFGPWLSAARKAVEDILDEEKYGWMPTDPMTLITEFKFWDLTGDGPFDGNDKNGILHYIHTYLVTSADNKFINDLYTIVAGNPIANINNLFCSENSDRDPTSGLIGTLMAVGDDYVAFKSRSNTLYGPPVKILNDERKNIFDNPAAYEALSQILNSGVIEAGGFADTKLIDGVYFKLRPDGVSPVNVSMKYTLSGVGTVSYVVVYGRYEIVDPESDDYVSVQAYNYNTTSWDQIGVINGKTTATDREYQFNLTADHRFGLDGEVHIKFVSSDENDDSHLYIDYCDVFYDLGTTRFVRVKRTADTPLAGNGDIFATANTYDEHQWMYYDKGELNPLYRTYFREIWFCIELMRYSSYDALTPTGGTADGKSASSPGIDEATAWTNTWNIYIATPYGAAPGGAFDSEARIYYDGMLGQWVGVMYFNRVTIIGILVQNPDPGKVLRVWIPLVRDTYGIDSGGMIPNVVWGGDGVKVGEYEEAPGRYRSYLLVDMTSDVGGYATKLPTEYYLYPGGGVRETWDGGLGAWYREPVQDNIFVYEKSTFFDDPISPPVVPPP